MPNETKETTVNIRITTDLKHQGEELFRELGLTFSTACTMFIKQAVREQRIPFVVSANVSNTEIITPAEEGTMRERELTPEEGEVSIDAFMQAEFEKSEQLYQPLE